MELMEKVLDALSDGLWHDINELSTREELRTVSKTKLMLILNFLAEYDFIELSQAWKGDSTVAEAKLQPSVQEFRRKIRWVERTEKGGKADVRISGQT